VGGGACVIIVGDMSMIVRRLAVLVALVLVADLVTAGVIGTRGSASTGTTTPSTLPTTMAPTTTTTSTTAAPVGIYPLTGLPAASSAELMRPALSIKIDNAADARPQSGLDAADIVTEEVVEGGLTRFLATYQSQDAASVGPIRSARPVDTDLLTELGGGLFAYSGGAAGVVDQIRARSGAILLTPEAGSLTFHRVASRRAPANLYSSTALLYAAGAARAPDLGPPPPLFAYSPSPTSAYGPGTSVSLSFSGSATATWSWNPLTNNYDRGQNGVPATELGGAPLTATDVVILSVATVGSGDYDVLGHENPLSVIIGSGPCWALRDGVLIRGTWHRVSPEVQMELLDSEGQTIDLQPGRTWLELLPLPAVPVF